MSADRSSTEANDHERARMRAIIERLGDDDLRRAVNASDPGASSTIAHSCASGQPLAERGARPLTRDLSARHQRQRSLS